MVRKVHELASRVAKYIVEDVGVDVPTMAGGISGGHCTGEVLFKVAHAVRIIRTTAVAQSQRAGEHAFKEKLQRDMRDMPAHATMPKEYWQAGHWWASSLGVPGA